MHSNRSSLDDTDVLKKELATVQRLMDELSTDKERELADLQKKLVDLQTNHAENKETLTTVQGHELIVIVILSYHINHILEFYRSLLKGNFWSVFISLKQTIAD